MSKALSVLGILFLALSLGCGDDKDTDTDTDTDTDVDVIYEIQTGVYAEGETVTATGVVAGSETKYGFFLLGTEETYGGIYVYLGGSITGGVTEGDEVQVTGAVGEFASKDDGSLTQLQVSDAADVTILSTGKTLPAPVVMTPAELAADPEPYESMLITLDDTDQMAVTNNDLGYGEWELAGTVVVDDMLYVPGTWAEGDSWDTITGLLYYSYGAYKLEPRYETDFTGFEATPCPADKCIDDLVAGDLVVTELMYDCTVTDDDYCEWFEVYNATGGSVEMQGLIVYDDGDNTATVSDTVIVSAGEYAVFGRGTATNWGYADFTADYNYGSQPAFNNSGDQVFLANGAGVIDSIPNYGPYEPDKGETWQLDKDLYTATDNDDPNNWCAGSTAIGSSGDYGTPGDTNTDCL